MTGMTLNSRTHAILVAISKIPTWVEVDPKAPFSIATTTRCRGGATPFPELPHSTLDPYLKMLSVKQEGIKYQFWVFGRTRPGIEPRFPRPLASTLLIRPIDCLMFWTSCTWGRNLFIKNIDSIITMQEHFQEHFNNGQHERIPDRKRRHKTDFSPSQYKTYGWLILESHEQIVTQKWLEKGTLLLRRFRRQAMNATLEIRYNLSESSLGPGNIQFSIPHSAWMPDGPGWI